MHELSQKRRTLAGQSSSREHDIDEHQRGTVWLFEVKYSPALLTLVSGVFQHNISF